MKTKLLFLFVVPMVVLGTPLLSYASTPPVNGSTEELFWTPPATIHNYENPWDLHSVGASAMAVTELEVMRLGDRLISMALPGTCEPLQMILDEIRKLYLRLPQARPILRAGELVNSLQIPEISLSDFRFYTTVTENGGRGGISPIMQTRIYLLLVWAEDVLNDVDGLVMFPVNQTLAAVKDKPFQMRTIGYGADGIGFLRRELFSGLRAVNQTVVYAGSRAMNDGENILNIAIRAKRIYQHRNYAVYVKIPRSTYQKYRNILKPVYANEAIVRRNIENNAEPRVILSSKNEVGENSYPIGIRHKDGPTNDEEMACFRIPIRELEKAPKSLRRYVITSEESFPENR